MPEEDERWKQVKMSKTLPPRAAAFAAKVCGPAGPASGLNLTEGQVLSRAIALGMDQLEADESLVLPARSRKRASA